MTRGRTTQEIGADVIARVSWERSYVDGDDVTLLELGARVDVALDL